MPEIIPQPELKGWWKPGTIESWWQSAKYLEVQTPQQQTDADVFFVTSNIGKFNSAKLRLPNISLAQVSLDIDENQESVEKIAIHKAKTAYSILCKPVLCDDSGFVIPSLNGYPGHHVGRELKARGIEYFTNIARQASLDAYFLQVMSYMDERLAKPQLFISKAEGTLIGEQRGDMNKPWIKSPLGVAFILKGQTKTIAEMSEEEYKTYTVTDRWEKLNAFLTSK